MSPDIADRKFTIAIRTAWVTVVFLFAGSFALARAAYQIDAALARLTSDHWGQDNQVRFASTLAQWNPTDPVPDPQDIIDGRASINPITVMAQRGKNE